MRKDLTAKEKFLFSIRKAKWIFLFFLSPSFLSAATFEDYYRAGTALYSRQQFEKALLYFQAAQKLNPAHRPSWIGAGNCAYHLKNEEKALAFYEQALKLDPSDSALQSFVEKLRARLRPSTAFSPQQKKTPRASLPEETIRAFKAGDYETAARGFKIAAQESRKEEEKGTLLLYLAAAEEKMEKNREAVLHYRAAAALLKDPKWEKRAKALESRLEEWDQDWVKEHWASGDLALDVFPPVSPFGVRFLPELLMFTLDDLESDAQRVQDDARGERLFDPTLQLDMAVPPSAFAFFLQPFWRLSPRWEGSLFAGRLSLSDYFYELRNSTGRVESARVRFQTRPLWIGAGLRRYFVQDGSEGVQFFIGAEAGWVPLEARTEQVRGLWESDFLGSGRFQGAAFDAGFRVGVDFRLASSVFLSPQGRFRFLKSGSFTGTFVENGRNGKGRLVVFEETNGKHLRVLPDDPAAFGVDPAAWPGVKDFRLDLTGLEWSLSLSVHF